MRECGSNSKVGPAIFESFQGLSLGDVNCVLILLIDLGEGLDEIGSITLVAAKSGPNRVGINCDTQVGCDS